MGDEDVPAANFPLGECEGDCNSDSDCAVCVLSFVLIVISPPPRRCDHLTFLLFLFAFSRDLLFVCNDLVLSLCLVVSDQVPPDGTTATIPPPSVL
jgi:hypothetical protein